MKIDELGLSVRARNVLRVNRIRTIAALLEYRPHDLSRLDGCGPLTAIEIETKLKGRGLSLRGSVGAPPSPDQTTTEAPVPAATETAIAALALREKTLRMLTAEAVATIADLVRRSPDDLRRVPGLGLAMIREIETVLSRVGHKLRSDTEDTEHVELGEVSVERPRG